MECIDLDFFYQTKKRLNKVTFAAPSGALVGLFGHNGSGKSTLLKLLGGSLPVARGQVKAFSRSAIDENGYLRMDLRREFGVLFQGSSSDEKLSLFDNLRLVARLWGMNNNQSLEQTWLTLENSSLSERAHEPVKKLSGGMRRRLELYRTFIHRPKIVLLDEPTAGLDVAEVAKFFEYLKNYRRETGALVLMSSHHADELLFCDQVIMMKEGQIVSQGSPRAMLEGLDYFCCSFMLNDPKGAQKLYELELYDQVLSPDGWTRAKVKMSQLDPLLNSPLLRDDLFKSFSIARPSLGDVYKDLCNMGAT